ncbi:hypothetical protein LINPERHAP2_LOCUS22222 [Linum perenne]
MGERRSFLRSRFRADRESVSHLFLSCPFVSQVWRIVSSKLAIWGPNHFDVREFIREWQVRNSPSTYKGFKDRLMHAIFWSIWGERNNRIFRNRELTCAQIVWKVARVLGRWMVVAGRISHDEFRAWLAIWGIIFDPG